MWLVFDKECSILLSVSSSGKIVIELRSDNWKVMRNILVPYFYMCYGEKLAMFRKIP